MLYQLSYVGIFARLRLWARWDCLARCATRHRSVGLLVREPSILVAHFVEVHRGRGSGRRLKGAAVGSGEASLLLMLKITM